MATDSLFPPVGPTSLGPTVHLPGDWAVRTTRIAGARSAALRSQVRLLAPNEPGVYAMLSAADEVIYVGKAKNLRKRLLSYFRVKGRDRRTRRIVGRARAILWEVLPTEFTAFLRELELIRRWRPACNVQGQPLRRRHAYICLGHGPAYLTLTRKPPRRLIASFGPLPVTRTSRSAVRWLNDAFSLRDCPPGTIEFFPAPNPLFPIAPPSGCLRMELKTCVGPCTAEVSRSAYQERVRAARAFLEGRDRSLLTEFDARMRAAAAAARYESAALLRDKAAALVWLVDRLDRLKTAQKELSFIYPLTGSDGRTMWYLIHGARVLGCVAEPRDQATAKVAIDRINRFFGKANAEPILDAYEPIDGMILILGWFRKYPRQRRRAMTPAEALRMARSFCD